jgi:hypothetical protein
MDDKQKTEAMFLLSVLQLLVTEKVPSLLTLSTLMMEAIRSSETSVLTRATRRHIPEDDNFQKTENLRPVLH